MKVVLDANVLLSGLATSTAAPGTIITMWEEDAFELSLSEHILNGVTRALGKPYWQRRLDLHQLEDRLSNVSQVVDLEDPVTDVHGVAEDDEDDLVLATAVAAKADYLVTGDKYLLRIAEFRGIPIVSPRNFLTLVLARE